ncbi:MAG: hypothetical protein AAF578_08500 [Pseudomonadota bacterium]
MQRLRADCLFWKDGKPLLDGVPYSGVAYEIDEEVCRDIRAFEGGEEIPFLSYDLLGLSEIASIFEEDALDELIYPEPVYCMDGKQISGAVLSFDGQYCYREARILDGMVYDYVGYFEDGSLERYRFLPSTVVSRAQFYQDGFLKTFDLFEPGTTSLRIRCDSKGKITSLSIDANLHALLLRLPEVFVPNLLRVQVIRSEEDLFGFEFSSRVRLHGRGIGERLGVFLDGLVQSEYLEISNCSLSSDTLRTLISRFHGQALEITTDGLSPSEVRGLASCDVAYELTVKAAD